MSTSFVYYTLKLLSYNRWIIQYSDYMFPCQNADVVFPVNKRQRSCCSFPSSLVWKECGAVVCLFGTLHSGIDVFQEFNLRNECLFFCVHGKWTWVRHVTNPVNREAVLGRFVTASPKFISHECRKIRHSFLIFTISSNIKPFSKTPRENKF